MSSKRIIIVFGTLLIAFFAYTGYTDAVNTRQDLQNKAIEIQQLKEEKTTAEQKREEAIKAKQKSQEELKKKEEEKQQLKEEQKRLEAELQAKAERKAKLAEASRQVINIATNTQTASAAAPTPQGNCGDNAYAAYIYGMESGGRVPGNCDVNAMNAGGCGGIGQACPASKMSCGADYSCQNAFFSNYALTRYGSWADAYAFHKANGWW